jgi:hypothetical protein
MYIVMPLYTESQKKAIYKYRETHAEKHSEYNKKMCLKYYYNDKEKYNKKRLQLYYYQKECKRLRSILLDI